MEDRVSISIADGIADVRLVRADKMNALDQAMFDALVAATDAWFSYASGNTRRSRGKRPRLLFH